MAEEERVRLEPESVQQVRVTVQDGEQQREVVLDSFIVAGAAEKGWGAVHCNGKEAKQFLRVLGFLMGRSLFARYGDRPLGALETTLLELQAAFGEGLHDGSVAARVG